MKTKPAEICPACDGAKLREQRRDYTITAADGVKVVVPNLLVEVCDYCSEVVLSADAADAVDAAIAEQTEQLTTRDLERIRDDLGVDQTEMSEILGLGGKTYHRWEKGNQVPSRSMGFYLRILAEFPEAFLWLRERGWRRQNRPASTLVEVDFKTAYPDLAITEGATVTTTVMRFNPAKALFGKAA
jgi:putative zinc finger/helix-turn-helix YgiT family protein